MYKNMGTDGIFGRSDISSITGDSVTAAGNLISKLKAASLIVPVKGLEKANIILSNRISKVYARYQLKTDRRKIER